MEILGWFKNLFKEQPKSRLGIDLGGTSVRLVEISSEGGKIKLETYGLASLGKIGSADFLLSGEKRKTPANMNDLTEKEVGDIVRELVFRAKVKTNMAYFAVPGFAIFSTMISLPEMPENEIASAVPYEARKYIPVPLEEVVLDWVQIAEPHADLKVAAPARDASQSKAGGGQQADQVAGGKQLSGNTRQPEKKKEIKVFLVAILKEVIEKYAQIAQAAGLELRALEAESFCLARSLAGEGSGLSIIIDIDDSFTDITLVEDGFVKVIHNAESVISRATGRAEMERLSSEIEKVLMLYNKQARKHAELSVDRRDLPNGRSGAAFKGKFIVIGGRVSPGDLDFLKERFTAEIVPGNPFSGIKYPAALESALKELSPTLAVAAGMAMRQ